MPTLTAESEEHPTASPSVVATSPAAPKLRSCAVCRGRKVRCDKQSPCSNCRRANIACILPPTDSKPRWARKLERRAGDGGKSAASTSLDPDPGSDQVMNRLRSLEHLVKELRNQLEQARAATISVDGGSSGFNSSGSSPQPHDAEQQFDAQSATTGSSLHERFGRLVLQDASRSRYISSGFWSRVEDEMDLEVDHLSNSEDEPAVERLQAFEHSSVAHHMFPFREPYTHPSLQDLHPLPSLIPFLLDVFSENINRFIRLVHVPTITKMLHDARQQRTIRLTPSNEALMFAIYYATIASMEEDDVMTNFGTSKADLISRYRLGLERSLTKADFLNAPDTTLVQAFALYLCLARRHDSPRWVWMMTGLVIRMAQFLGLHRDGTHFPHMTPFQIQHRRMVWWAVCMLDLRASEDQGTDLTIVSGSFDTKIPININDADISPETRTMPIERHGLSDMTSARIYAGTTEIMRQMTASVKSGVSSLEEQDRLLRSIYERYEEEHFQHNTDPDDIVYWVSLTIARLVMAKMTLIVSLPVLFSSPETSVSEEIRDKLLISAIEVAEYNHELNAEERCRQWRWVYQTHTHWHAIVYLMIETSRRSWSAIVERAWVALHSTWLMPARGPVNSKLRIWIPLRKLMERARQHREEELLRLQADPLAASRLEVEDEKIPRPTSSGPFESGSSMRVFRERWRQLVGMAVPPTNGMHMHANLQPIGPSKGGNVTQHSEAHVLHVGATSNLGIGMELQPSPNDARDIDQPVQSTSLEKEASMNTSSHDDFYLQRPSEGLHPSADFDALNGGSLGSGFEPWLWPNADQSPDFGSNSGANAFDSSMDIDGEINWLDWVQAAKDLGWNALS